MLDALAALLFLLGQVLIRLVRQFLHSLAEGLLRVLLRLCGRRKVRAGIAANLHLLCLA